MISMLIINIYIFFPGRNMEDLKLPLKFLNFTGLLPRDKHDLNQKIRGIFFYCTNLLFVISLIIEIWQKFNDFSALLVHLSIMISPTSYFFKISVFETRGKYFNKIMKLMKEKEFKNPSTNSKIMLEKTAKYINVIMVTYGSFCAAAVLLYSLMPTMENINLPISFSYNIGVHNALIYTFQVLSKYPKTFNHYYINSILATFLIGNTQKH